MANLETFFTDAFENLTDKENFYKAVFMNAEGEEAARLRDEYYRLRFKSCGKNVHIGVGVKIHNPQNISVGDNVYIDDGATLIARGNDSRINIGNGVSINERVYIDTESDDSTINIGNGVYIGTGTTLFGHVGLDIGDSSLLAQNITITPYSHKFDDPNQVIIAQGGNMRKVTIGRDVYIGMNTTVLYSADIGEGSVIGSASVVVKTIPPYSVAVGNPAKVFRKRGEPKK